MSQVLYDVYKDGNLIDKNLNVLQVRSVIKRSIKVKKYASTGELVNGYQIRQGKILSGKSAKMGIYYNVFCAEWESMTAHLRGLKLDLSKIYLKPEDETE